MAGNIGRIDAYDESAELWTSYQERLEQCFFANDVEKKVPVLLRVVGGHTNSILRDLTSADIPGTNSYDELTTILKRHFNPTHIQIAERFRFHKRDQKEGDRSVILMLLLHFYHLCRRRTANREVEQL